MSARSTPDPPPVPPVAEPLRPYAVVDLDGTVADVRHRLIHVSGRSKDWGAFFAAAVDDDLLPEGAAAVTLLAAGHDVVWLTGRPERCRGDTERWLARHRLPAGRLVMRRAGDRRPARLVKLQLLRRLARERRVAVVIDDDDAFVAAARAAGFSVLHATWMDEAMDEAAVGKTGDPSAREVLRALQERPEHG